MVHLSVMRLVRFAGSPFSFQVQTGADASKVRVSGSGIQSGILATFQSTFLVDTRGAGPGRLTVRVRGPKGKFSRAVLGKVASCRLTISFMRYKKRNFLFLLSYNMYVRMICAPSAI
jgi:hypothetical protein